MGNLVSSYLRRKGKNPFADAIGRNESGELTVDVGRVLGVLGEPGAINRQKIMDFTGTANIGTGQARVDDVRKYTRTYYDTTGGDADIGYTYQWNPVNSGYAEKAFNSAIEAFKIKEQGQKEAARIAQEGRDKARQANFGAELAAINRQAQYASEDNAREQGGGTPDVVLSSDTDIEDAPAGQGVNARRRRAAFSGGGLRI